MTTGEKFRKIRLALGLNQAKFAEPLGITDKQVSAIEKNRINPSSRVLELLMIKHLVNRTWWDNEEGSMFLSSQPETIAEKIGEGYDPEVKVMADYLQVRVQGKSREERLRIIDEIMEDIRRRYK